jgi:hypothetical protein
LTVLATLSFSRLNFLVKDMDDSTHRRNSKGSSKGKNKHNTKNKQERGKKKNKVTLALLRLISFG